MIEIVAIVLSIIAILSCVGIFIYLKNGFNENAANLEAWAEGMERRTVAIESKLRMYIDE